jgi:hypothetical protein
MYTSDDERTGNFTFNAEGSTNPASPYFIGRLSHPSAQSGVTIGAGYDMGGRTVSGVKNDLILAGVDTALADKLSKGAGLTFAAAENFVQANRTALAVKNTGALQNLFAQVYPRYVAVARANFKYHATSFRNSMKTYGTKYRDATFFDWEYLFPAIRVIAIDFAYQGFGRPTAGYGKPMHFCMANNFKWLIDYITGTPGLSKYEAGRGRAQYLRSHMQFEMGAFSQCGSVTTAP